MNGTLHKNAHYQQHYSVIIAIYRNENHDHNKIATLSTISFYIIVPYCPVSSGQSVRYR